MIYVGIAVFIIFLLLILKFIIGAIIKSIGKILKKLFLGILAIIIIIFLLRGLPHSLVAIAIFVIVNIIFAKTKGNSILELLSDWTNN